MFFWFILIWIGISAVKFDEKSISKCYDADRNPQRCVPELITVSEGVQMESTNTCGNPSEIFYLQAMNKDNPYKASICDASMHGYKHGPEYLTDGSEKTWWQSETMATLKSKKSETVNLTIYFPKAFNVEHIRLIFMSPIAESFAILKKRNSSSDWTPWQYFSSHCLETYGMPADQPIIPSKDTEPQCTSKSSNIVPLSGGTVIFEILKDRILPYSANLLEEREGLDEWMAASAVRISLKRMNTFGDERYGDDMVLRSYYYAISDLRIAARCRCNGHAPSCGTDDERKTRCDCEHNTAGDDCEVCREGFWDREWRAATATEANECLPCQCNGLSSKCRFDKKLFEETGSGSKCYDCEGNTQGNNCELCKRDHYRPPKQKHCSDCDCDPTGSKSSHCDELSGQCECRDGIGGRRCDRCLNGFFDFSSHGCRKCNCSAEGSSKTECGNDGKCFCKQNVEGDHCNQCKFGTFGLKAENPFGCSECFCWGHSSQCVVNTHFYSQNITSTFQTGKEGWKAKAGKYSAELLWSETNAITVRQNQQEPIFFYSPREFRTNLRSAFGRFLEFDFFSDSNISSLLDFVRIKSGDGRLISFSLKSAKTGKQRIRIRLDPDAGWTPRYRVFDFRSLLSNVTELSIRGTFAPNGFGLISNVQLETADRTPSFGFVKADWMESCNCGNEYFGSSCEECNIGYRRVVKYGGPAERCVPCECNGHAEECNAESGICECLHNTAGDNCERCALGFYAQNGSSHNCQPCGCPYNGDCIIHNGETHCLECPLGHTGPKCLECIDGFYGDPANGKKCRKCNCNDNTDPNDIGGCDKQTGECRRCIHNTTGRHCDRCLDGFFGDASIRENCSSCDCYSLGSLKTNQCDQTNGQCKCLMNVSGRKCDHCLDGYYNLSSGKGCIKCDCDPLGSNGEKCDVQTGQCECKFGVDGKKCDKCAKEFFGLTEKGCKECQCNRQGSQSPNCDSKSGQCLCHEKAVGLKCDQCEENHHSFNYGCLPCDKCYSLIQSRRNFINHTADIARQRLDSLAQNPVNISDPQFYARIQEITNQLNNLNKNISKVDRTVGTKIDNKLALLKAARRQIPIQDELDKSMKKSDAEFRTEFLEAEKLLNETFKNIESIYRPLLEKTYKTIKRTHPQIGNIEIMAQEAERFWKKNFRRTMEAQDFSSLIEFTLREMDKEINQTINGKSESITVKRLSHRINTTFSSIQFAIKFAQRMEAEANSELHSVLNVFNGVESANLTRLSALPKRLESKSRQIKNQLHNLQLQQNIRIFKQNITEAKTKIVKTKKEFKKAAKESKEQKQRLTGYHKRAQKALEESNETERRAKETLEIVNQFVSGPAENRQKIQEELRTMNSTQKILADFFSQQRSLSAKLSNLKSESENVQTEAVENKQKAASQQKETGENSQNLREQREKKENLNHQISSLIENLDRMEQKNRELEQRTQEDEQKVKQKFNEAKHIQMTAANLKEQLSEFGGQLDTIAIELELFVPTNVGDLDELEKKIIEAEKLLEKNEISKQIKIDELERNRRKKSLLKAEMTGLQNQMETLRLIANSIPDKCFNHIGIEKE